MIHLKLLENQQKAKSKSSIWKEIIKVRVEPNETETKEHCKESMK
jgi:hypothetical protein